MEGKQDSNAARFVFSKADKVRVRLLTQVKCSDCMKSLMIFAKQVQINVRDFQDVSFRFITRTKPQSRKAWLGLVHGRCHKWSASATKSHRKGLISGFKRRLLAHLLQNIFPSPCTLSNLQTNTSPFTLPIFPSNSFSLALIPSTIISPGFSSNSCIVNQVLGSGLDSSVDGRPFSFLDCAFVLAYCNLKDKLRTYPCAREMCSVCWAKNQSKEREGSGRVP